MLNKNNCENAGITLLVISYLLVVLFILTFPRWFKKSNVFHLQCVRIGNTTLDCWSLSHFLFYIFLGFLFPHYWKLILCVGIIWEIGEYIFHEIEKKLSVETIYWCAKFSDIWVNTLGFAVGFMLRYAFMKYC